MRRSWDAIETRETGAFCDSDDGAKRGDGVTTATTALLSNSDLRGMIKATGGASEGVTIDATVGERCD